MPAGTSGGMTVPGTVASLAGSITIAVVVVVGAVAGWVAVPDRIPMAFIVVVMAGVGGSLLDSVLGGTVQAVYRCPGCGLRTERLVHGCGQRTVPVRGIRLINNDVVNAAAALFGAGIGLLWLWIG